MVRIEPGLHQPVVNPQTYTATRPGQGTQSVPVETNTTDRINTAISRSQADFGRLQSMNERANVEAGSIQGASRRLEKAQNLIQSMKWELMEFVKNYPPYPPGDTERIAYLRNFINLRREIEQIIIPPDAQWLGPQPGEDRVAAVYQQTALPVLDESAAESDVQFAVGRLDAMHEALIREQEAILSRTMSGRGELEQQKAAEIRMINEDIVIQPVPEDRAELDSEVLGRDIRLNSDHGLAVTSDLALIAE